MLFSPGIGCSQLKSVVFLHIINICLCQFFRLCWKPWEFSSNQSSECLWHQQRLLPPPSIGGVRLCRWVGFTSPSSRGCSGSSAIKHTVSIPHRLSEPTPAPPRSPSLLIFSSYVTREAQQIRWHSLWDSSGEKPQGSASTGDPLWPPLPCRPHYWVLWRGRGGWWHQGLVRAESAVGGGGWGGCASKSLSAVSD